MTVLSFFRFLPSPKTGSIGNVIYVIIDSTNVSILSNDKLEYFLPMPHPCPGRGCYELWCATTRVVQGKAWGVGGGYGDTAILRVSGLSV